MTGRSADGSLPRATIAETLAVGAEVVAPNIAKGPIIRRPRAVRMAERLELDRRSVRRLQKLRARHPQGPVMLRLPVRKQAVILDPAHVRRVLEESPDPFATASSEKRAALSHFEPKGSLISHGAARADRRRYNEAVLQGDRPLHPLADRFTRVAREEAQQLTRRVRQRGGALDWPLFSASWFRVVRRVVLGDAAREDRELRSLIDDLRSDANWAFMKPRRHGRRARFFERLNEHLTRAEPGSLAQMMASVPHDEGTAPDHQVPQWLFAFDPAGMAAFRTLALLATHRDEAAQARQEAEANGAGDAALPYLRASVLESLRLWPTTPMVLRQTTRPTEWEAGVMPAGTGILILAPFFHRDDERLPFADRFAPEVWTESAESVQGIPRRDLALIPFSDGPAICPGRSLVLLLTSHLLASLLRSSAVRLARPSRLEPETLPATLDHFSLRFQLTDRPGDG